MQRLRPPGTAGRRYCSLLLIVLVSLALAPASQVAAEPAAGSLSSFASTFRSYLPTWAQGYKSRRLQQVDDSDHSPAACAEVQYTCQDASAANCTGCDYITFTVSAPLYQLISNGSCADLDGDLGLYRCGQTLVQASTVQLVQSAKCTESCKTPPTGASKECAAPPAPAPAPSQSPSLPPAPAVPSPTITAAPAPSPAPSVIAVPAPGPAAFVGISPPSSPSSQSPTPVSTPQPTKVLDAFVSGPPRRVAAPPPPPAATNQCFDGPIVTATALICGLTSSSLNATQLQQAIAASLLYNNASFVSINIASPFTNTQGPGCAFNSSGSSTPNTATTSCQAVATPVTVYAPSTDAASYIAQVLSAFPQNIALGLPYSTDLGPVCVNYAEAPGEPH